MPLVIGVTGSIATGKSAVCETLVELGAVHCNADTLVHQLYAPGTPGFERVVAEFGQDVVAPDGTVDRKILGSKVFGNPEAMGRLTRAMGDITGLIRTTIEEWRGTLPEDGAGVMEAVNLIEPGYAAWCDQVWLAAVEPETASRRLMARNGFTAEEAGQRLASQRDWRLRAPAADFVIHNDGTLDELRSVVRTEFERIRALKLAGTLPPSGYHAWREQNPLPVRASQPEAAARSER
jgi:dephospho-CoA kinase